MRILFLNDSARIAGAEKSLALLTENLDATRFEKAVVCPPGPYSAYLKEKRIPVIESDLYYYAQRTGIRRYLHSLVKLGRLTRSWRPDIIHCNSYRAAHWGIPLARLLGIGVVCHIRDARYTRWSAWLMKHSPRSARFIAISAAVRQALLAVGVHPARIDVIHNCADLKAFHAGVKPACDVLPKGGLRLGVFGRIEERKRVVDAVEALSLLDEALNSHLFIVGEAWTENGAAVERELRSKVRALGVEDRVTFTGYRTDIPEIIAALDIVLMPAEDEPFARAVLEGMCMGKPVIGTTSGGVPEVIEDGQSGLLVPPRDPRRIAEAIRSLVADPTAARRLGRNGQQRAINHFSVEAHLERVEQAYKRILTYQ
ncbi:MAG: glycosyltransferase family 4 protein [Acidobacteriota bacterium]